MYIPLRRMLSNGINKFSLIKKEQRQQLGHPPITVGERVDAQKIEHVRRNN